MVNEDKQSDEIKDFVTELVSDQEDLEPELYKILNENYWDLLA